MVSCAFQIPIKHIISPARVNLKWCPATAANRALQIVRAARPVNVCQNVKWRRLKPELRKRKIN